MPRRKRESKRRGELTLEWSLLLTIGPNPVLPGHVSDQLPEPESVEYEALRACWFANRAQLIGDRPPESAWGYCVFELDEPFVAPELEEVRGDQGCGDEALRKRRSAVPDPAADRPTATSSAS